MTIQELAQLTLLALNEIPYSKVDGPTVYSLNHLASGASSDCVFFDNAGELAVTVWLGNETAKGIIERLGELVFAYRLDGKDIILRRPCPHIHRDYLEWVSLDADIDTTKVLAGWDKV